MNIYISTLLTLLPNDVQSSCINPKAKILGLRVLADLDKNFNPNFLYVGNYQDLNNLDNYNELNLLLFSEEKISLKDLHYGHNIIVMHNRDEYTSFISAVQEILANQVLLSSISNNLITILQNNGDIQKILDYGFDVLNNPIMVVDASFDFIACVGTNTLNDEPLWQYAIENGVLPQDYIATLMQSETDDMDNDPNNVVLMEEKYGQYTNHNQVAAKIISNNIVVGYVKMLEKNRMITAFDKSVLICLSNFLSIIINNKSGHHPYNASIAESFLTSIISQKIKNPEEIESRQSIFNIKLYDTLHIITIEMNKVPSHPDHIFYLLKKFKKFFGRNIVIIVNTRYVVLYDTKNLEDSINEAFLERFSSLLEANNCTASVSLPFKYLKELYLYYEQTLFCFELKELLETSKNIINYQDIIEYHMIIQFGKLFDLNFLIHPAVNKLLKMDEENEGNLVETLFTYIKNQQNISATAKIMFIHYNTLKYRINRIEDLCNFDFSNDREVFLINLSEKVLRIRKIMGKSELLNSR